MASSPFRLTFLNRAGSPRPRPGRAPAGGGRGGTGPGAAPRGAVPGARGGRAGVRGQGPACGAGSGSVAAGSGAGARRAVITMVPSSIWWSSGRPRPRMAATMPVFPERVTA